MTTGVAPGVAAPGMAVIPAMGGVVIPAMGGAVIPAMGGAVIPAMGGVVIPITAAGAAMVILPTPYRSRLRHRRQQLRPSSYIEA